MRTGTALTVGVFSGIVLTVAFNIGLNNTVVPQPTPSNTTIPKPTPTPTPSHTTKVVTKNSDAINYPYGQLKLKVTETDGTITAVEGITLQASGGRQAYFKQLAAAAVAANGSNFSNISGATYTTEAYKKALDSALSKF